MYNNTECAPNSQVHSANDHFPADRVNRTARDTNTKSALSTRSSFALESGTGSRRAAGVTIKFKLKNPAHGSRAQESAPTTKFQLEKQTTALATTAKSPRAASNSSARTRTARRVTHYCARNNRRVSTRAPGDVYDDIAIKIQLNTRLVHCHAQQEREPVKLLYTTALATTAEQYVEPVKILRNSTESEARDVAQLNKNKNGASCTTTIRESAVVILCSPFVFCRAQQEQEPAQSLQTLTDVQTETEPKQRSRAPGQPSLPCNERSLPVETEIECPFADRPFGG
ncbi:hypothetical protein EXIGLDRAFT_843328 [Exidia glandulosa HHB12029]|uniref:Uncharacterized protein n=1 Tax=Exidia glandulosa HHB12029 TaxID=1314781 RepID=A0A165CRH1_EXIGL|nr:hypothetical protein EXIGLDRAFT_843328 [Exidia glandulosa HHB12029]